MPTLTTLVSFDLTDGWAPSVGLIADAAGDLFGTAGAGGTSGEGTVFEIVNTPTGYASTPTVLLSFSGTNGGYPSGGLVIDAAGDLVGTTDSGGANSVGVVFEIANTPSGYASTSTTLVSFNLTNGANPAATLITDAAGDLFGTTFEGEGTTTYGGGSGNLDGTVFELAKTPSGYASAPTTLVTFTGTNGANPEAALIADAAGDLFGTTVQGGGANVGTVFEIVETPSGYANTPTILVTFNKVDGAGPNGSLIADAAGDLFGTTQIDGTSGYGTVFEIAKTTSGYSSTPITLVSFNLTDGESPGFGLIADAAGDLFGTTVDGGTSGYGTVFEIAKTPTGYASTPTTLVAFNGADGAYVSSGLIADAAGDLFGTTEDGGTSGYGTVFELTDSGFQVACYLRGTRIWTPAGERKVESLETGDVVLTASGLAQPIIWVGHRHLDCRKHPRPIDVWPVHISAGAFGDNLPRRDLWLSPDHAVFAEGVLIPIKHLINGMTIVQEARDHVAYWHIELALHDVILAEGLPCESYLDNGTRNAFANGGSIVQMHPDFSPAERCEAIGEAVGCAPLCIKGEAFVRVARRLHRQAAKLGHTLAKPARRATRHPAKHIAPSIDLAALLQSDWYLANNPDVAVSRVDASVHYAGWGVREGRLPCPEADLVRALGLIDPATVIRTMPDVIAGGADPADHFCTHGWRERRRPNAYFDTGWYLDAHDVPEGVNPLVHYVLFGEKNGLSPSRHFDSVWYRQRYFIAPSVSALAHFLAHRRTQKLSPRPSFDVAAYVQAHAATLRPNRDPYAHFLAIGRFAGEGDHGAAA